ncbi:TetR/AcrR family transcriptional regulator [Sphingomonas solaris]|nr:TetR/AcrR family transcriptional regulator [Sphingomonas solaris]
MSKDAETPVARYRDAARTRESILRAGQKLFAEQGYPTTGIRDVAAAASVNSALIQRYFGSKEGLLRATLEDLLKVDAITAGDRTQFGKRAVSILLAAGAVPNPVAIMALAMSDASARKLCIDLLHHNVIIPMSEWLGGNDALARAARLNTIWTGFITARYLLPVEPLNDDRIASTRQWLERVTQAIADEN